MPGLCGSPVLYRKISVSSSQELCKWFCWCSDSVCSSHCCRNASGDLGWLSVQALPSIMDDGAGDLWMLVCAFYYITHIIDVDRSHNMRMVKDNMGLETPMITWKYISETGCTMKELMKKHQGDLAVSSGMFSCGWTLGQLGPPDTVWQQDCCSRCESVYHSHL